MTDLTFDLSAASTLGTTITQAQRLLQQDPVQGLVDYFLDVKPFHTKLLEIIVEYLQKDAVRATILEEVRKRLDIQLPSCPRFSIVNAFANKIIVSGDASFLTIEQTSVIKDGVYESQLGQIVSAVYSAVSRTTVVTVNAPSVALTQFIGGTFVVHCQAPDMCPGGFGVSSFGSSPFYPAFYPGGPTLPYNVINKIIVTPGKQTARFTPGTKVRLYFNVIDDTSGSVVATPPSFSVYTVASSSFFPGFIPARTISGNPATLDFGVDPYTTITFVEPFSPIPPVAAGQTLIVFAELLPFVIQQILPYSAISPVPGVMSEEATHDNAPDESAALNIGSNCFVINGNYVDAFRQGVSFDVLGGENDGTYSTLYSDFVGGQTRIRPVEDIRSLTAPGQITFHTFGYSESDDYCPTIDGNTVKVKIKERLTFVGLGLNFTDDVIAYNLENRDVAGFELPNATIFSQTEPTIYQQPNDPRILNPGLPTKSLWFNTTNSVLYMLFGAQWRPTFTVTWMETDSSNNYIQLWWRTMGLSDSGWRKDARTGFDAVIPAQVIRYKIVSVGPTAFVVSGDPTAVFSSAINPIRVVNDGLPGVDIIPTSATHNPVTDKTTINVAIPSSYVGGELIVHLKNAFASPFGNQPYQVYHSYVTDDGVDVIRIDGGNYLDRFGSGLNFTALVTIGVTTAEHDGLKLGVWLAKQLTPGTLKITLDNPARASLIAAGSVLSANRNGDAPQQFQVLSIGPLVGNVLTITTSADMPDITSVAAAIFNPFGPNGNPQTTIIPATIPAFDSVQAIYYNLPSPIWMHSLAAISDGLDVSNGERTTVTDNAVIHGENASLETTLASAYIFDSFSFKWGDDVSGDITEWFQYSILSITSFAPADGGVIVVHGDSAYLSLPPGQKIRILGLPGFDGVYTVISVIQDTIDPKKWTVAVSGELFGTSGFGGFIEPVAFSSMTLTFRDSVLATATESASTTLSDMPLIGGYDTGQFDIGPFDENINSSFDLT
jgi:hypothetical protein